MKINPDIFKAYDIRGKYGKDFDEQFAFELGNKFSAYFDVSALIVGMDGRESSGALAQAVMQGALAAGADVVDIGEASTPLFYEAVNRSPAVGGIMVTASHNPDEWNGFKVMRERGVLIGGAALKDMYEHAQLYNASERGQPHTAELSAAYADDISERVPAGKLNITVSVRAPSGTKKVLDVLAGRYGITFEDSSKGLQIIFDGDGDRIIFLEDGHKIAPDFLFLLLSEHLGYKQVVYDLRFSRAVPETLKKLGIKGAVSKAGRLFMHEAMNRHKAQFGAEISGHFFFRDFYGLEAPELVMLQVLKLMKKKRKSLAQLVRLYQKYVKSDEITLQTNTRLFDAITKLMKKYSDGKVNTLDGLTVEYPDWWFNVRASNTEPVSRMVIEANTPELLKEKTAEVLAAVRS